MRLSSLGGVAPRANPVLVLGTDDVASAIGHALASAGIVALLVRDPKAPVLRRGMSFDDALEYGSARLEGLTAYGEPSPPGGQGTGPSEATPITVTAAEIGDLLNAAEISGVIDARMRPRAFPPVLRHGAPFIMRIGAGFGVGQDADMVIAIAPSRIKRRVGLAPRSGLWWTFREIGESVEAGAVVGLSGGMQVPAPVTGALCGLVRRGTDVLIGSALVEVDPRGSATHCFGIPPENAAVGAACVDALRQYLTTRAVVIRSEAV